MMQVRAGTRKVQAPRPSREHRGGRAIDVGGVELGGERSAAYDGAGARGRKQPRGQIQGEAVMGRVGPLRRRWVRSERAVIFAGTDELSRRGLGGGWRLRGVRQGAGLGRGALRRLEMLVRVGIPSVCHGLGGRFTRGLALPELVAQLAVEGSGRGGGEGGRGGRRRPVGHGGRLFENTLRQAAHDASEHGARCRPWERLG